ncbi:FAD-dependent oxidoreductase [Jannaschia sp. Os4]|uniref:FAD-dependent oxidoreductase n=1 Tax=Jannaschia sp. Os4 TaxID=2807617 RepID=UPI00193A68F8|nr:FAD-dependent oxidoreductase [Jannaschia sp. Os4]MBM2575450.1 FAD-dependent oxidoreductase [Jannaschia sp. Os4]
MPEYDVAALAALSETTPTHAKAGDTDLVLVREGDTVHALDHACPHLGLPLSKGVVRDGTLICAFHHACFRLDGTQTQPPGTGGLRSYPVAIRAGRVIVDAPLPETDPRPVTPTGARRVVIGGAGACADEAVHALRGMGFDGTIEMVAPDGPPYDRTMLSKAVLTGAKAADALVLTDEDALARQAIVLIDGRIASVEAGRVVLEDGTRRAFDHLLLAPGGRPNALGVPGEDHAGVHVLRNADQAEALAEAAGRGGRAVVVGGGFIGLEAAASLAKRGMAVTLLTREAVPLAKLLGDEVAGAILAEIEAAGVEVHVGEAASFEGSNTLAAVVTKAGDRLPADIALVAIGVTPATKGIDGLPAQDDGGVRVGPDLSVPGRDGVHVGGDCAEAPTPFGTARIEHWRVARQHGRRFARAVMGVAEAEVDIPFFWTALGRQYRYVGHAGDWDEVRIDGDPSGPFVARYVEGGRVTAAFGAGRDADLAALHLEMKAAGGPLPA